MIELNVIEQLYNLGKTSIIQEAWSSTGGRPYIHGWVFDLETGYICPQSGMINSDEAMRAICKFESGVVGRAVTAASAGAQSRARNRARAPRKQTHMDTTMSQAMSQPSFR